MMLMSFSSKRNSKLESHLKRALPQHVYDDIRYYESCIVKRPKEGVCFTYLILTGKAVLLASYPFKGVKEAVRLHDIVSIKVELDIPPFLKGSQGHKCQHIRVSYKNTPSIQHIFNLNIVKEELEEVEDDPEVSIRDQSLEPDTQDEISTGVVDPQTNDRIDIENPEVKWEVHNAEQSVSSDGYSRKTRRDFSGKQERRIWDTFSSRSLSSTKECAQSELKVRSSSSLGTEKARCHNNSTSVAEMGVSMDVLSECRSTKRQSSATPELQRSISSLLRRVQYSQPRPSRSYSSMATYADNTSPLLMAPAEKRSQSVLERPRRNSNPKSVDGIGFDSSATEELHIYVLQAKPILLNNLQYSWCALLLDETLRISKNAQGMNKICDIFLLENLYQQIKNEIMSQENSIENTCSLLQELFLGFQEKPQLKYIFWKDQMLYHFIVQKLEVYMISADLQNSLRARDRDIESDIYIEGRQDELEVAIVILDILSTVLHDTDNIHDKMKMLHFRNGSLIQQLLSIVTLTPRIYPKFYNTCCRMLEDFNEFSTYAWKNLPEGVLISLCGTIINKVCTIISELLTTLDKLAETNINISVSMIFKDIFLENYIKRSITQLLGLLFPVEQKNIEPEESIIVYQHFFVLKYLMGNLPHVTDYIREHYQEELRYYILWSRVNTKVPEKYPIKRILRPLVEYIHTIGSDEINMHFHALHSRKN